jgi:uncharacterized membrane protein
MRSAGKRAFTGLAAVFYTLAGTLHFLRPAMYLRIMPPYIPWDVPLVYISGAAEIAGGLGLLVPRLRRKAAWGLVILLIAVFPANVYMATDQIQPTSTLLTSTPLTKVVLWGRLPLQAVLIWWVLWCTKENGRFSRRD